MMELAPIGYADVIAGNPSLSGKTISQVEIQRPVEKWNAAGVAATQEDNAMISQKEMLDMVATEAAEASTIRAKAITAKGPHRITAEFEAMLCAYTAAPFAVAVDNATNAIALCLWRWKEKYFKKVGKFLPVISIPCRTYMSVACEIKLAGFPLKFREVQGNTLTGEYELFPTNIWDSALRFTADMYRPGQMQCVSFTGCFKHLKLGKGGAILLDNEDDYNWLKKARNSGRDECSYHDDTFTMLGRNCYMMPDIAARGLLLMGQFYDLNGNKIHNEDKTLPYPDLSAPQHTAYK